MLGQTGENITPSIKIELFAIIANLRDLSMADHCMQLGRAQLNNSDDKMHAIIYWYILMINFIKNFQFFNAFIPSLLNNFTRSSSLK